MKILLLLSLFSFSKEFTYSNGLKIKAPSYKEAAKLCYSILTRDKYPGEELGLYYIDLCANPTRGL